MYCMDMVNKLSPTFVNDTETSLYHTVNLYRNVVGHTIMDPDTRQGVTTRAGNNVLQVVSTEHWAELCGNCGMDSEVVGQGIFHQWKKYLLQMYIPRVVDTEGNKYEILSFRWANFGWGKTQDGTVVHHPMEVWLYTCEGDEEEEWYKEKPTRVCFGRAYAPDGTAYKKTTFTYDLEHDLSEFDSYDGPIPLTLEKQHDLHSLRPMIKATGKYDDAYLDAEWPAPTAPLPAASDSDDDDDDE